MKKQYIIIASLLFLSLLLCSCAPTKHGDKTNSAGSSETKQEELDRIERENYITHNRYAIGRGFSPFEEVFIDGTDPQTSFEKFLSTSRKQIREYNALGNLFGDDSDLPNIYNSFSDTQKKEISSLNFQQDEIYILIHLGYCAQEIINISKNERNLIFPHSLFQDKLDKLGITYFRILQEYHKPNLPENFKGKYFIKLALQQPSDEIFIKQAQDKNIEPWEYKALLSCGYTRKEILDLSKQERDNLLVPGNPKRGIRYISDPDDLDKTLYATWDYKNIMILEDLTQEQKNTLNQKQITDTMALTLNRLGYTKDDILNISKQELDYIFPNENLRVKLNKHGFNNDEITNWERRLKYIIKECIEIEKQS